MLTLEQFGQWLNPPGMSIDQHYSPARLLDPANFVEIDAESYDHMLNALPPLYYSRNGFAMCEAATSTHRNGAWTDIRLACFRFDGHYYAAHVTDQAGEPEGFNTTAQRIAAWITTATP